MTASSLFRRPLDRRSVPRPGRRSIAARITWMNALVSGIALLLAYLSFLAFNVVSYRQTAVDTLYGDARITAANSASAILFNDPASAQTTLSALSSSEDVTAAAVYLSPGESPGLPPGVPFAQFTRDGAAPVFPRPLPRGSRQTHWVDGMDILIGSRIELQGKQVGVVYIQAHLHGLRRQAIRYGVMAAAILLFCMGVALVASALFRRILAQPFVSLAETARQVTRYRDYTLRFTPAEGYSELLSLTGAFNEMLEEIQLREQALRSAKDELELRVEERTAQLKAANRELESFSYTVAHDLRGPLQIISSTVYLIKLTEPAGAEQSQPDEARATMFAQLDSSVTRMAGLIDDLLNLSRSTSSGLHLAQVDLSHLAASILGDLARSNPERQVEIVVEEKCHVNADPGLMEILLHNLLRNAWKFTGRTERPRIEFGCTREAQESVFHVRDNGAGFDQRSVERLFKPFQRLHTETEFSGTGIGLATVQRIIERHEGKIWAEGKVDQGATFYFTLGSPKP